jgi:3-oxoacyl-[acyl-carrier-protein] synthase II
VKNYIDSIQLLSHKQLVMMLARQRHAATQGIAVVGMGLRLPGSISTPAALWEALRESRVVFGPGSRIPVDSAGRPRWNLDAPDLAPYADLVAAGSYLADVDLFDAERYGFPEEEARFLDPQERLLITCTAEALADAGADDTTGQRTGVFAALSAVEYPYAAIRNGIGIDRLTDALGPRNATGDVAAQIATCFRLAGPAVSVDTACSSALTALHLACAALRSGECDTAIVGASHLVLAPTTFTLFDRWGLLSPTGRTRPFDAEADGYVRGEGCGVMVLRRQDDTDSAYAAIRGTAVHHHGDHDSSHMVSSIGMSRAIRAALRAAQVSPGSVGFVEAHANGVKLAAVIEAEVLADVYGRIGSGGPPLIIGSSKANFGYLESVSGMASLMKAVLAVHHAEIPPQAGFKVPDPAIAWDKLSLAVPGMPATWPAGPKRLAGVNAYGITGTYCHALVESVAGSKPRPPRPLADRTGRSYWPESHRWS